MPEISIARDFSAYPAGRKIKDGPYTGERFRNDFLLPSLNDGKNIILNVDGVEGLPSSFWEEIFGGLVRLGWSPAELKNRITILATNLELSMYPDLAWRFADEAGGAH